MKRAFTFVNRVFIATDKPALVIALPTGLPHGVLPNKLLRFGQRVAKLLPSHDVSFSAPIAAYDAHAMNLLIDEFRLDPRNEWFLFWNPEIEITPEQLAIMVACNVGVVGALYADNGYPTMWRASFYPDMKADERGLLAVPEIEAHAKLYHRTVFDVIEQKTPGLGYIFDQSGRSLPAFCQERTITFGEYQRMLRPAYFLDYLCRACEVVVFAHVGIRICAVKEPYRSWEHTRLPPPECAEEFPEVPHDPRKIAVCLQYCDKDKIAAHKLKGWIENLTNHACPLFHSPGDKYPSGPNETATWLMRSNWTGYKAVLLIEPDCIPVQKDWLEQLSNSWDRASAAGKLIMGSWHPINVDHPTLGHINGNLMFHPKLAKRVSIPDVPDKIPWDTFLADVFQPHWCRTGLIKNLNRHRTATRAQMVKPECGNKQPVLVHGIRDESAWNLAKENFSK